MQFPIPTNEKIIIEKIFNEWKIKLSLELNNITIKIKKDNLLDIYETSLQFKKLKEFKLFSSNKTINEIFELIIILISQKKIQIIENDNNINLILFNNDNDSNANIILNKKKELSVTLNKNDNFEKYCNRLDEKINQLFEINNKLEKRIEIIEKDNKINQNNINSQNSEFYKEKIDKLEKQITSLSKSKNIQNLKECNLKCINTINCHNDWIRALSIFPISGNIISCGNGKKIIIYDINFNIIQTIENAHSDDIVDINILDENNFISCSLDKSIKIWIKKKQDQTFNFNLYYSIKDAHQAQINKIIYYSYGKIISCSIDYTIKIWEEYNNNYQLIITLNHSNVVYSILLLKDENILISSGVGETKIWNFNNFELIFCLNNTWCARNALKRIDDDHIIIGGDEDGIMKIISLSEKKIIKHIKYDGLCWGICLIHDKNLLIAAGKSNNIKIYNIDDFECIQNINSAHNDNITGIIELKNGEIASFGKDNSIKIWNF